MVFSQEIIYLEKFHHLLKGIQLFTLILLELDRFNKKFYAKSNIDLSVAIYLE